MWSHETPEHAITTPIHTFIHPEFESQVNVIGMMHVAQPNYYRIIQAIVDHRDNAGAIVHYEGIKSMSADDLASAPRSVVIKAEYSRDIFQQVYSWFDEVGLVRQKNALNYHKHWENHDMTESELLDRLNGFALRRQRTLTNFLGKMHRKAEYEARQEFILSILKKTMDSDRTNNWMAKLLLGVQNEIIIDDRNAIALSAFDEQQQADPEADVVLLWGAGHLPGLGVGLQKRGFVKVDVQKVTAIVSS